MKEAENMFLRAEERADSCFLQQNNRKPGTFLPGESGNPHGRPKGSKGLAKTLRDAMEEGQEEEILKKIISMALDGDHHALKICADRLIPVPKVKDTPVYIGDLKGMSIKDKAGAIIDAMSDASVTPQEAISMMQVLSGSIRILEFDDLLHRIEALEKRLL